jgi:hypothetical protein
MTEPGRFVSQVVSGRLPGDALGSMEARVLVRQSSFELTGNFDPNFGTQRWGDTSSVRFDPSAFDTGWAANEIASSSSLWGTHIHKVSIN